MKVRPSAAARAVVRRRRPRTCVSSREHSSLCNRSSERVGLSKRTRGTKDSDAKGDKRFTSFALLPSSTTSPPIPLKIKPSSPPRSLTSDLVRERLVANDEGRRFNRSQGH